MTQHSPEVTPDELRELLARSSSYRLERRPRAQAEPAAAEPAAAERAAA